MLYVYVCIIRTLVDTYTDEQIIRTCINLYIYIARMYVQILTARAAKPFLKWGQCVVRGCARCVRTMTLIELGVYGPISTYCTFFGTYFVCNLSVIVRMRLQYVHIRYKIRTEV